MVKIFMIDGGAGRVIAAIPALLKYAKKNPDKEWYITVAGWDTLLWGIPELQHRCFNPENKGVFDNLFMRADKIICPEPYKIPGYYKQQLSISEAFDEEINETNDHSDLDAPILVLQKLEIKNAQNVLEKVKEEQKKKYTIIIQPFGRSARVDNKEIIDDSTRSLNPHTYIEIVKRLRTKYNVVNFTEQQFHMAEDTFTMKPISDLRGWAALIYCSDYFVGVDSVGQHMARALNKPGTVILGSTFAINTTYPNYFKIFEKQGIKKYYSPIRISNLECNLADRLNEKTMSFTTQEIDQLVNNIDKDIQQKVGK